MVDKRADIIVALQETRERAAALSDLLDRKVGPRLAAKHEEQLAKWRQDLGHIFALTEKPDRVRVALVGTTGAGKSTFLNAILGQPILPVSVMAPCTAFVTSVSYSTGPQYSVDIYFFDEREWPQELSAMVAAIAPGDEDQEIGDKAESRRVADVARKRIEAVFGIKLLESVSPASLLSRPLPPEVERLFKSGSRESISFAEPKEMTNHLRKLIRGDSAIWPLVKRVEIRGPYEWLSGGIELVDLPGLNDPNEARVEVTYEFLRTSPFVWVVFPMVRGLTNDIQRIMRDEKLLRTLVLSGTYEALTLVGTKADDIDANMAEQFGLPEDCPHIDLVRAYRERMAEEARHQLEEMVRDLAGGEDEGDTLRRMLDLARRVRVHTTSANAYMKICRIGGVRKDYGINELEDTGIPEVQRHLKKLGESVGMEYNNRVAEARLESLCKEMEFFFRGEAPTLSPDVKRARSQLQQELQVFTATVQRIHDDAQGRLRAYRERFMEKLDSLLASSVEEVAQAIVAWRVVHWATLRAVVARNGLFKSPSTGKSYDFNADIAEPLLATLPISWERYFTDELGRVVSDYVLRIEESGRAFADKARLIVELLFGRVDRGMQNQTDWFLEKMSFLAKEAQDNVQREVKRRRIELAEKMPLVAKDKMAPAYDASKRESGPGMKQRILGILEPAALDAARPVYATIQEDLLEGLSSLELVITGVLRELAQEASAQARLVTSNANIDVDEAAVAPDIAEILSLLKNVMDAPPNGRLQPQ